MKTPIHVELLDDPDVQRFAAVAGQFCELIENVDKLPKADFLQQILELLPVVYSIAHRVPDPYDWQDDDDEDEVDLSDLPDHFSPLDKVTLSFEWSKRIGTKVEPHNRFRFVFDPMDKDNLDAIDGTGELDLGGVSRAESWTDPLRPRYRRGAGRRSVELAIRSQASLGSPRH
jgi:hypothetical protein